MEREGTEWPVGDAAIWRSALALMLRGTTSRYSRGWVNTELLWTSAFKQHSSVGSSVYCPELWGWTRTRGRNKREKGVSVSPLARTKSKMTPKGFPTHNEAAKLKCGTSLPRRHWLFPVEITWLDKAIPLGEFSCTEGKQIRTLLPAAAQKSSQQNED